MGRRVVTLTGVAMALAVAVACSGEPERSVEAYCARVTKVQSLDEVLHSGDASRISTQLDELRALQQVAPPEIEAKVGSVTAFADDYARTLGTVKNPDDALHDVSERRKQELPAIVAASNDMQTYTYQRCNVALGPNVPGTGTTVPGDATTTTTVPGRQPASSTTVTPH